MVSTWKNKSIFLGLFLASVSPVFSAVLLDSIGSTAGPASPIKNNGKGVNFVIASGTDYTLDNIVLDFASAARGRRCDGEHLVR